MKCVVLGGGGFIGSAIADRLLLDGHHVRIFERAGAQPFRSFSDREAVEWMTGDLFDHQNVNGAIAGCDTVVHLVSSTLPKSSNDDPVFDVQSNVVGTLHLLNAMVAQNIRKIIFISSGGTVYGKPAYLPVDEDHPTNPIVSYGVTKLAIEKYLTIYEARYGINAITLRVTNPFGERQRIGTGQGAVGVFLHRALTGQPIEIWGDGNVVRDFIHVSDVADAFARCIDYDGPHRLFNISSGEGTSLNELVGIIRQTLGAAVKCNYQDARSFDTPVSILSNALAMQELGWAPRVSLQAGIARTAAWMRESISAAPQKD